MASAKSFVSSLDPSTPNDVVERAELSEIDASTKAPTLFFLVSGVLWLLVGTVFALIASTKLHTPHFMGDQEWLTFGRARTAHLNAVVYGWAVNASFLVVTWLMARLSRCVLRHPKLLLTAGAFWNIGVTIGIVGILLGDSTSVEWLEMPQYATPLLFVSYAMIGVWAIVMFRFGKAEHIYVSQWYILAALFWFPWIYSVAQIMLFWAPARGTVQGLVNWWYAHNVLGLWLTPVGLASIYYFLPKVLGKPIHSYYLSVLGFWSLAIFYNWAGVHHLIGGPVPAWVQSAGIAASLMMLIPVVVTGINHHMTMVGNFSALKYSPTLRFIVFGAVNYTLTSVVGSFMSLRSFAEVAHFTQHTVAHAHHGLYSFFTMVMFGAIYYILPRLTLKEWPSATLISLHFWSTAAGSLIMVLILTVGGLHQGFLLNTPSLAHKLGLQADADPVNFLEIVRVMSNYLVWRSLSGILIFIGHIAFAISVVWMLLKPRTVEAGAPTLFRNPPEMEVVVR